MTEPVIYDRYPCQSVDYQRAEIFPCQHKESGGKTCERLDKHDETGHAYSDHTIKHERMGNGWSCEAIDEITWQDIMSPNGPRPYVIIGMRR